jgi:hypothetical protein
MLMNKHWTKYISIISFSFILFVSAVSIPVQSATFLSPEDGKNNVSVNDVKENLYISGNDVNIQAPVQKDLVIAGNTIKINNRVERDIIAAGNQISINSPLVGGTVRLAAQSVDITGNYAEDMVVFASDVTIKDTRIRGDLIVNAGKITLQNSIVGGKFYANYTTLDGDLQSQINGEINITQYPANQSYMKLVWLKFAIEISTLIGLAIITFYLYRRHRLNILKPKFNTRMVLDFVLGFCLLILPIFVLMLGIFLQIYPLLLSLWALIWILFAFSNIFLPIYLSSVIKNTFNVNLKLVYLIPIVYVVLLVLNLLPVVGVFFSVISFILLVTNFGYLSRNFFKNIDQILNIKKLDDGDTIAKK